MFRMHVGPIELATSILRHNMKDAVLNNLFSRELLKGKGVFQKTFLKYRLSQKDYHRKNLLELTVTDFEKRTVFVQKKNRRYVEF